MTRLEAALRETIERLAASPARFALVGELAVSVRATPCLTGRLEVAVADDRGISGIEREVVAEAEDLEILPGLRAPVARAGHLIAMKLLARDDERSPLDMAHLRWLVKVADAAELARARAAVKLIAARGFARDKDLVADLDALVADSAALAREP